MKSMLSLGALALAFVVSARASVVHVDDPSAGTYLNQQGFTYNGTTIAWRSGLPEETGFFVQSFNMMGLVTAFGEWNGAPFGVTAVPLGAGASVQAAPVFQGQLQLTSVGALFSNQYYGIRYGVGGGSYQYGWIRLSSGFSGALIHGIAFNTLADDDILTGQTTAIPEPGSYAAGAALAVSAFVLGRRRRLAA